MAFFDKLKNLAFPIFKKSPSAIGWLLRRSPLLLRRVSQAFVIYGASLVTKKALDVAHEKLPDNEFIAKADTVAQKTVAVENALLGMATSTAKDIYEAIPPATAAEPAAPNPAPEPQAPVPVEAPTAPAQTESAEPVSNLTVRNRANLNAALMPPLAPTPAPAEPAPDSIAPDGLPTAGGYEKATGIRWNSYLNSVWSSPGFVDILQLPV